MKMAERLAKSSIISRMNWQIGYDYTLVHLHPASFFNLDQMVKVDKLKVIQVNKDVGGPTVREMVPQLLKIIESGKSVLIGLAKLNQDDIDAVDRTEDDDDDIGFDRIDDECE